MKRNSKIALAVAILSIVVIVSVVAFLPYLTPESIQITAQKGFMESTPSIDFYVTSHLYARDAILPMNYSIIVNGSRVISEEIGGDILTDFYGNFEFHTGSMAMMDTPFQAGDTVEMKIIVNENGKIITQDFNMVY
jgi:hypothetical protein